MGKMSKPAFERHLYGVGDAWKVKIRGLDRGRFARNAVVLGGRRSSSTVELPSRIDETDIAIFAQAEFDSA
jgi:hypothetical protein